MGFSSCVQEFTGAVCQGDHPARAYENHISGSAAINASVSDAAKQGMSGENLELAEAGAMADGTSAYKTAGIDSKADMSSKAAHYKAEEKKRRDTEALYVLLSDTPSLADQLAEMFDELEAVEAQLDAVQEVRQKIADGTLDVDDPSDRKLIHEAGLDPDDDIEDMDREAAETEKALIEQRKRILDDIDDKLEDAKEKGVDPAKIEEVREMAEANKESLVEYEVDVFEVRVEEEHLLDQKIAANMGGLDDFSF